MVMYDAIIFILFVLAFCLISYKPKMSDEDLMINFLTLEKRRKAPNSYNRQQRKVYAAARL